MYVYNAKTDVSTLLKKEFVIARNLNAKKSIVNVSMQELLVTQNVSVMDAVMERVIVKVLFDFILVYYSIFH
jgi:hypothetical protein